MKRNGKAKSRIRIAPLDQIRQIENNDTIEKPEPETEQKDEGVKESKLTPEPKKRRKPKGKTATSRERSKSKVILEIVETPINEKVGSEKNIAENALSKQSMSKEEQDKYEFTEAEILEEYREPEKIEKTEENELQVAGGSYGDPDRQKWTSSIDFLLSIIGFAVDLANVWRFPYLFVKHGGSLFLIPYTLILIFGGIPVFYMELIMGQYVREGCISIWKICPLFKGIGVCMCLIICLVIVYYNVILAWSMIYIYESCFSPLQWTQCGDKNDVNSHRDYYWARPNCSSTTETEGDNAQGVIPSSAADFFQGKVLEMYEVVGNKIKYHTIEDLGHPDDSLVVTLLTVYFILLLVLVFGIRVTGKVVWFTATLPYFIFGILLFRGVTLPGSREGLVYFLRPRPEDLARLDTWTAAGVQVFNSLGVGFGVHLTLASFNRFQHNMLRDCLITAAVNSLTSILAGLVIFAFLGNMAYSIRVKMEELEKLTIGTQLVFQLFPQAVGRLPGANFFAFIFFLMVFAIGIDTAMSAMQTVQVAIIDNFKEAFKKHAHSKEVFMFVLLIFSFLISLTCVTQGGIFVIELLDANAATVSLIFPALLQCTAIAWIYGTQNLCCAAEMMTGRYPHAFFIIAWKFIAPVFLTGVLIATIVFMLEYVPEFEGIRVPNTYYYIGLIIAVFPSICIPLYAVYTCIGMKTSDRYKNRLILALSPEYEHEQILTTGVAERGKMSHYCWLKLSRPKDLPLPIILRHSSSSVFTGSELKNKSIENTKQEERKSAKSVEV